MKLEFDWMMLIRILAFIVVMCMIYTLAEANAKIFFNINQFKFEGNLEVFSVIIKSLGFSTATIILIIYYKNLVVKILFALIDGFVIYFYYEKVPADWWMYASKAYALYATLTLIFVGTMIRTWLNKKITYIKNKNEAELNIYQINEQILSLKKAGRGKKWQEIPERVEQIENLELELKKIKDLFHL